MHTGHDHIIISWHVASDLTLHHPHTRVQELLVSLFQYTMLVDITFRAT